MGAVKTTDLAASLEFYEQLLGLDAPRPMPTSYSSTLGGTELCIGYRRRQRTTSLGSYAPWTTWPPWRRSRETTGLEPIAGAPNQWLMVRDPEGNEVVFEAHTTGGSEDHPSSK